MVAHFAKLGSPLKCIHQYPTSESQVQRYTHLVKKQEFNKIFLLS
jgi:hypothetical protein